MRFEGAAKRRKSSTSRRRSPYKWRVNCLVIGGGAIGGSIAWRLAQRGLDVGLVERGPLCGEATWAAAGILAPQAEAHEPGPLFDLQARSRLLWPAFAEELREASGVDVGYYLTGTLMLGDQRARYEWQRKRGFRVELRGENLFLPDDHSVDPRLVGRALEVALSRAEVRIHSGNARRILRSGSRVSGVLVDEEEIRADAVVVAGGAWTSLLEGLPRMPPIRPLRGALIELVAERSLVPHVIFGEGGYLVPRKDGRVLCGSSEDDVGFVKEVTPPILERLHTRAVALEPRLAGAEVSASWAGFRPATDDRLPVLGASELAGLHFATGHYRNGILLAPLTAEILAATVTGNEVDLAAFSPAR
jgi:glycine oxidase